MTRWTHAEERNAVAATGVSRVRVVVFGSGFGIVPPIVAKLSAEFEVIGPRDFDVPWYFKTFFLILAFRLPKSKWRRKWTYYLEKTPLAFRTRTRAKVRFLRQLQGQFDFIINFGAMDSPGYASQQPVFVICDSTRALSSRNIFDEVSHFANDAERSEWIALDVQVLWVS